MNSITFFRSRSISITASALLLTLTGAGCGNWAKSGVVNTADPSTYKPYSAGYTNLTTNNGYPGDSGYNCPASSSVTVTGGADPYVVCQSATDAYSISVHGTPTNARSQVCVFPVDVLSASQAYPATDSAGAIQYKCGSLTTGTAHLSFPSSRFNGVFVVLQADADSLAWCLQNSNYSACPAYSYERFGAYDTGAAATTGASH